jgi:hypothetical protein
MNQQVAVYDPRQQAPAPSFTMSEMERIALAIAKGRLFGSDDPNAVLTLCMVAQAEGKHPGLVMQQYHIIKGKPAKKAEAMLVDFLAAGGRVTWNRLDDECADATFSHPLGGEVTINWTIARATKAGLLNNDTWKKYPRQMLRSRVVSEGVRTVFPGATSGMYVPEEVQDFDNAPASETPPTPEPKRARDLKAEAPKQVEADPKRAKAETWLAWLRDEVDAAGGEVEAVRAIFADGAPTLAKLEKEYPDLYAEALVLKPSDDEQPAEAKAAEIKAALADAPDAEAVERVIAEAGAHYDVMPDEQKMQLDVAFSQARARFEQKALV